MEEQTQVKCAEWEQPTQNKPLFSRQMLVRLIIPLVIEQFLLMSVGMADTVMVTVSPGLAWAAPAVSFTTGAAAKTWQASTAARRQHISMLPMILFILKFPPSQQ